MTIPDLRDLAGLLLTHKGKKTHSGAIFLLLGYGVFCATQFFVSLPPDVPVLDMVDAFLRSQPYATLSASLGVTLSALRAGMARTADEQTALIREYNDEVQAMREQLASKDAKLDQLLDLIQQKGPTA